MSKIVEYTIIEELHWDLKGFLKRVDEAIWDGFQPYDHNVSHDIGYYVRAMVKYEDDNQGKDATN